MAFGGGRSPVWCDILKEIFIMLIVTLMDLAVFFTFRRILLCRENLALILADMLQMEGLDLDKNAVQRIESGKRFVTDIGLKVITKVLGVSY